MLKNLIELPVFHPGIRALVATWVGSPVIRTWLMRIHLLIAFILTVFFSALAEESSAQRVTLNGTKISLAEALATISEQTGYDFLMAFDIQQVKSRISIHAQNEPLNAVLEQLFAGTFITYEIKAPLQSIILRNKAADTKRFEKEAPHLILAFDRVTGRVVDSLGNPLAGASVRVLNAEGQRTTLQTTTDQNGYFLLRNVPEGASLEITYIGYISQTVKALANVGLIVLPAEPSSLEEVEINAGYYTVKDRERTGSISRVLGKEIELQPIVSPLEALQGRVAGVEITQRSGVPGNAPVIRIRGRNSLRDEGNYPLYIIDGVPINSAPIPTEDNLYTNDWDPLSTLNLSNIESVEILKDADATAIYGSRGANGVVLITTKKGREGKTEIEARWYTGFAQVGRKMEILNTEQYIAMRRAAIANAGLEPEEEQDWDLLLWDTDRYTDWPEELLGGTSPITDINVAASGGNATTSFRLGGSYSKQGTVFPLDNSYFKATTAFNLNHTSENKKFGIDFSANYGFDKSEASGGTGSGLVTNAYTLAPNAPPLYNEDGSLHWEEWAYSRVNDNPLAEQNRIGVGQVNNLVANLGISYKLFNGLDFKTNLGYTFTARENKVKTPNTTVPPWEREDIEHSVTQTFKKRLSWIVEPQLNYHKNIGKGTIDALIGSTFQKNESDGFGILGRGFVSEILLGYVPAAELYLSAGDSRNLRYKYSALYGRLGYNWDQKYYVNLTGRRDGSSRFGPDKRFSNFWAVGGAWIFSEEPVVENNLPFLSFGKLRGSYGTTGNDQIGDYQYLDVYEATYGPNGLYATQLFNANFAWEENKKLEAAVELGFIKDRISLGASWYSNRSSNQLVGYPLPGITGFTSVQANLPATVRNTGWEIELSSLNIKSKNFRWQTFFNISFPKNKLVNFPDIDQTSYANRYRIGHPLNISLLYQYDGIDPETGLYQVIDVNQDGRYDYQDRIAISDMGRKYFGGVTNNISYRGVQLSFLWRFVKQTGVTNPGFSGGRPGDPYNRPLADYEAWQNGDLHIENSLTVRNAYSLYHQSNRGIVDASFLQLKTISLGYDLPSEVLHTLGINSLRIFTAAQNLLTITSYSGLNMEFPGGSSLPPLRMVTAGLQLHF